ncbi:hypothetical protein CYMTET_41841 [Cymbomonas tetramitiformis]|uniref:SET domain-containing protein n=1 Tax=Cymbomonas tetramitiformis TaxID=36881 RepID=A0AAE0C5E3_9CHLO|nr:hypothetical protein CYMTET_41841 [Cymbomonas tetramitiformis]
MEADHIGGVRALDGAANCEMLRDALASLMDLIPSHATDGTPAWWERWEAELREMDTPSGISAHARQAVKRLTPLSNSAGQHTMGVITPKSAAVNSVEMLLAELFRYSYSWAITRSHGGGTGATEAGGGDDSGGSEPGTGALQSVAATPAADAGTSVELPDLSRLRCGQRAEVFWKAEKEWFPGLWVADAGRGEGAGAGCGVLYEDGESETDMEADHIGGMRALDRFVDCEMLRDALASLMDSIPSHATDSTRAWWERWEAELREMDTPSGISAHARQAVKRLTPLRDVGMWKPGARFADSVEKLLAEVFHFSRTWKSVRDRFSFHPAREGGGPGHEEPASEALKHATLQKRAALAASISQDDRARLLPRKRPAPSAPITQSAKCRKAGDIREREQPSGIQGASPDAPQQADPSKVLSKADRARSAKALAGMRAAVSESRAAEAPWLCRAALVKVGAQLGVGKRQAATLVGCLARDTQVKLCTSQRAHYFHCFGVECPICFRETDVAPLAVRSERAVTQWLSAIAEAKEADPPWLFQTKLVSIGQQHGLDRGQKDATLRVKEFQDAGHVMVCEGGHVSSGRSSAGLHFHHSSARCPICAPPLGSEQIAEQVVEEWLSAILRAALTDRPWLTKADLLRIATSHGLGKRARQLARTLEHMAIACPEDGKSTMAAAASEDAAGRCQGAGWVKFCVAAGAQRQRRVASPRLHAEAMATDSPWLTKKELIGVGVQHGLTKSQAAELVAQCVDAGHVALCVQGEQGKNKGAKLFYHSCDGGCPVPWVKHADLLSIGARRGLNEPRAREAGQSCVDDGDVKLCTEQKGGSLWTYYHSSSTCCPACRTNEDKDAPRVKTIAECRSAILQASKMDPPWLSSAAVRKIGKRHGFPETRSSQSSLLTEIEDPGRVKVCTAEVAMKRVYCHSSDSTCPVCRPKGSDMPACAVAITDCVTDILAQLRMAAAPWLTHDELVKLAAQHGLAAAHAEATGTELESATDVRRCFAEHRDRPRRVYYHLGSSSCPVCAPAAIGRVLGACKAEAIVGYISAVTEAMATDPPWLTRTAMIGIGVRNGLTESQAAELALQCADAGHVALCVQGEQGKSGARLFYHSCDGGCPVCDPQAVVAILAVKRAEAMVELRAAISRAAATDTPWISRQQLTQIGMQHGLKHTEAVELTNAVEGDTNGVAVCVAGKRGTCGSQIYYHESGTGCPVCRPTPETDKGGVHRDNLVAKLEKVGYCGKGHLREARLLQGSAFEDLVRDGVVKSCSPSGGRWAPHYHLRDAVCPACSPESFPEAERTWSHEDLAERLSAMVDQLQVVTVGTAHEYLGGGMSVDRHIISSGLKALAASEEHDIVYCQRRNNHGLSFFHLRGVACPLCCPPASSATAARPEDAPLLTDSGAAGVAARLPPLPVKTQELLVSVLGARYLNTVSLRLALQEACATSTNQSQASSRCGWDLSIQLALLHGVVQCCRLQTGKRSVFYHLPGGSCPACRPREVGEQEQSQEPLPSPEEAPVHDFTSALRATLQAQRWITKHDFDEAVSARLQVHGEVAIANYHSNMAILHLADNTCPRCDGTHQTWEAATKATLKLLKELRWTKLSQLAIHCGLEHEYPMYRRARAMMESLQEKGLVQCCAPGANAAVKYHWYHLAEEACPRCDADGTLSVGAEVHIDEALLRQHIYVTLCQGAFVQHGHFYHLPNRGCPRCQPEQRSEMLEDKAQGGDERGRNRKRTKCAETTSEGKQPIGQRHAVRRVRIKSCTTESAEDADVRRIGDFSLCQVTAQSARKRWREGRIDSGMEDRDRFVLKDCGEAALGNGVFARTRLTKHELLFEYEGDRLRGQIDWEQLQDPELELEYMWELSNGDLIDARAHDGWAKYINCYNGIAESPNVVAHEVQGSLGYGMAQGLLVKFFAVRDITPGEQLLIDYGSMYADYDWEAAYAVRKKERPEHRLVG